MGNALSDAIGEEWAAVCYFYSAYHLARHALLTDPVWHQQTALRAINPALSRDDRNTKRHQGRRGVAKEWGINELVLLLYPSVVGEYEKLHRMSNAVRYEGGLKVFTTKDSAEWLAHIESEKAAGNMVA